MSYGARPLSHRSFQKLVFAPLPIVIVVHNLKRSLSASVSWICIAAQGLVGSVHFNHGHLKCSALLKHNKSLIHKPPSFFGSANPDPIDWTVTRWVVFPFPQEIPTDAVDPFDRPFGQWEGCHVVNWDGCEHRVYQS
jgi:hypothetical protein